MHLFFRRKWKLISIYLPKQIEVQQAWNLAKIIEAPGRKSVSRLIFLN